THKLIDDFIDLLPPLLKLSMLSLWKTIKLWTRGNISCKPFPKGLTFLLFT
ncbi:unnamed protein product, partial [Arabidopsis halleri]